MRIKIILIAFLTVIPIQFITNNPPLPQVQAEQQPKPHIAPTKSVKKKIVKHATKVKKAPTKPKTQSTATPSVVYHASANSGSAKSFIYSHESTNRTDAINPTSGACGLGQALPCSKMPCTLQDYDCQDDYFTGYMIARYGSWENAKVFWLANGWW